MKKTTGFHSIAKKTYSEMINSKGKSAAKITKEGAELAAVRRDTQRKLEEIKIAKGFDYL